MCGFPPRGPARGFARKSIIVARSASSPPSARTSPQRAMKRNTLSPPIAVILILRRRRPTETLLSNETSTFLQILAGPPFPAEPARTLRTQLPDSHSGPFRSILLGCEICQELPNQSVDGGVALGGEKADRGQHALVYAQSDTLHIEQPFPLFQSIVAPELAAAQKVGGMLFGSITVIPGYREKSGLLKVRM